ncbi:hypothetical protein AB0G06_43480 [Nonomuraea dietziae]|uniref:hypothetical protein n=1 Tax=Nonomuraea dietziae TaxID=65515 RepID=UPI0033FA9A4A
MTVSKDYCWSCNKDEPIPPSGAYVVCFECGHVYATEQDLIDAYNRIVTEMNADGARRYGDAHQPIALRTSADGIYFCQHCIHDF